MVCLYESVLNSVVILHLFKKDFHVFEMKLHLLAVSEELVLGCVPGESELGEVSQSVLGLNIGLDREDLNGAVGYLAELHRCAVEPFLAVCGSVGR